MFDKKSFRMVIYRKRAGSVCFISEYVRLPKAVMLRASEVGPQPHPAPRIGDEAPPHVFGYKAGTLLLKKT